MRSDMASPQSEYEGCGLRAVSTLGGEPTSQLSGPSTEAGRSSSGCEPSGAVFDIDVNLGIWDRLGKRRRARPAGDGCTVKKASSQSFGSAPPEREAAP